MQYEVRINWMKAWILTWGWKWAWGLQDIAHFRKPEAHFLISIKLQWNQGPWWCPGVSTSAQRHSIPSSQTLNYLRHAMNYRHIHALPVTSFCKMLPKFAILAQKAHCVWCIALAYIKKSCIVFSFECNRHKCKRLPVMRQKDTLGDDQVMEFCRTGAV